MKKSRKTVNETLGRHRKCVKLPTNVSYKNSIITTPIEIAGAFNDYFSNVGKNLASTINASNDYYKNYLRTPAESTCTFNTISETDVLKIIDNMDNKSSSGHDGISNRMLKFVKHELSQPISLK